MVSSRGSHEATSVFRRISSDCRVFNSDCVRPLEQLSIAYTTANKWVSCLLATAFLPANIKCAVSASLGARFFCHECLVFLDKVNTRV